MEVAYRSREVGQFAAWVHESDAAMQAALAARGYRFSESTRAMGMSLDEIRVRRPELDLASYDGPAYERRFLVPGLLDGADYRAFNVLVARLDGESVASAMALDFRGDRGIYNVVTLEHFRRRGLGTALTARLVHDAFESGFQSASLQSTPIAERVYAAVGFRDLGRILEYVPSAHLRQPSAPPGP
jgi:ribosomal protein S18 acetylase RimI-like enzyme